MNTFILRIAAKFESRRIRLRSLFTNDDNLDITLRGLGYVRANRNRYTDGNFIVDIVSADHRHNRIRVLPIFHIDPEQIR